MRTTTIQLLDAVDEFDEADTPRGTAANVEGLSRRIVNAIVFRKHRVHQIVDEKHIADLQAIAVDRNRLVFERPRDELCHPPVLFRSE